MTYTQERWRIRQDEAPRATEGSLRGVKGGGERKEKTKIKEQKEKKSGEISRKALAERKTLSVSVSGGEEPLLTAAAGGDGPASCEQKTTASGGGGKWVHVA